MKRILVFCALTTLLAACSGEAEVDTTSTALTTTSTREPETSTTTAPPPTTTASEPPTTTRPDGPEADGSGCTPGSDDLPDGLWYGLVADFDEDGISFDLACWFSGDAATAAAAEDGEESPPPNDYYVRNDNEQLRELDVDPNTPVLWYLSGDPNDFEEGTFSEWVDFLAGQDFRLGIWVTVTDDQVTEIEEMWVP